MSKEMVFTVAKALVFEALGEEEGRKAMELEILDPDDLKMEDGDEVILDDLDGRFPFAVGLMTASKMLAAYFQPRSLDMTLRDTMSSMKLVSALAEYFWVIMRAKHKTDKVLGIRWSKDEPQHLVLVQTQEESSGQSPLAKVLSGLL
jgi:hypothetical protein